MQLWNDLKKVVTDGRESHFFGSIVSSVVGMGANTEYHIIDGQQRLTTVTILLIAMRDYLLGTNGTVSQNQEPSEKDKWLAEQIASRFFKIYDYGAEYPLRLRPVSEDKGALLRLFNRESDDRDKLSRIEQNYEFFLSQ